MAYTAYFTDAYRTKLAQLMVDLVGSNNADAPDMNLSYFRVGEGGHSGGTPNEADPAMTDIEAQGLGTNGLYFFQKSFVDGDLVDVGGLVQVRMQVDADEGNGPGAGGDPVFYEFGIYDDAGTMLVYGTMDAVPKDDSAPVVLLFSLKLART